MRRVRAPVAGMAIKAVFRQKRRAIQVPACSFGKTLGPRQTGLRGKRECLGAVTPPMWEFARARLPRATGVDVLVDAS